MTYDELMADTTKRTIHDAYGYGIYQTADQKIYNVDHKIEYIKYVRDPLHTNPNLKVGNTVLVKSEDYGEIISVLPDFIWGNHQYEVEIFNEPRSSKYYDEIDLVRA